MIIKKNIHIWGVLLLISILFFPDIKLGSNLPAFQFLEFGLPITVFLIFINRKKLRLHKYYLVILLFCTYIPVTMAINGRLSVINDYFEIYKIIKFLILVMFFSLLDFKYFSTICFKPIFIILVVVNLLHFYNIFGFHDLLIRFYGGIHLESFGLNSLKLPATKRLTGLADNPNINAVIFGFYMIYFLPLKFNKQKISWFFVACLMLFLCQSRTAVLAVIFTFVLILTFQLSDWSWKIYFAMISSFITLYLLSWAMTTDFFTYQSYSNNIVSNSAISRFETWKYLGGMIKDKPIFGYGVNKNFFYKNKLFSENEYILTTWRYGAIGLVFYLLFFLIPLKNYIFNRKKMVMQKSGILIIGIIMVTALTNNPFQDRTIIFLIALTFGLIWPFAINEKTNSNGAKA